MKKRGILFGMILSCAVMTAWGCGNEKKLSSIEGDQAASSSSEDGGGKDSEDSKFKDDKSEDDNPFDTEEIEESGQEVLANYGWGIENFDAKKRELSYDGKTMEIDFSFDNSSKKFQAGRREDSYGGVFRKSCFVELVGGGEGNYISAESFRLFC